MSWTGPGGAVKTITIELTVDEARFTAVELAGLVWPTLVAMDAPNGFQKAAGVSVVGQTAGVVAKIGAALHAAGERIEPSDGERR